MNFFGSSNLKICLLAFCAGIFPAANVGATTIGFQVSQLGTNPAGKPIDRFTYSVSDLTLQANQEIDIRFDPALYAALSNPVASSDFLVLVLQPDNPTGTFGDYSATALIDHPSLAGPFSVDFTFIGMGSPGSQPFFINQYDTQGNFLGHLESGNTVPQIAPEPGAFALSGLALIVGGVWSAVLGKSKRRRPVSS